MAFDPLDNAVWHTLAGPRRALGEHRPRAARFVPEVSMFAAIVDEPDAAAWADLGDLVGPEGVAVLFRRRVEPPAAWETLTTLSGVQMVAVDVGAPDGTPGADGALAEVVELGAAEVPEMLELVAATQPGPFGTRTVEFGGYVGVRREGRLVAMAGERLRLDGHTEITAVCTDERFRGQGLAGLLVRVMVHRIRERGETAFLHAAGTNETAIRLYDALGFETRALIDADVVRAPRAEPRAVAELPLPCGPMKPMTSAGANVGSARAALYLEGAFGRRFGGLWAGFSKDGGRLFVGVVDPGDVDRQRAAAAPDVGGAVEIVAVRYSNSQLDGSALRVPT